MKNKTGKRKIGKIIKYIVLGFIGVLVVSTLLCALLHATYFKKRYEQIQPYGELVDVFDGKMHITKAV